MSFNDIENFVNTCEISITESEIKDFLSKEMDKRKCLEKDIKSSKKFKTTILENYYRFEPHLLEYFKTYTSILKEKCKTLFAIVEDLFKIEDGTISKEEWNRIVDLDFHINEYGIYIDDAERLIDAIIYNVKNLYEKITKGNNPETYLTYKKSKNNKSNHYLRKEVQLKNLDYKLCKEFIALSENQKEKLKQQSNSNILIMKRK